MSRIDLVMIGGSLIGVDAGTRLLGYLSHRAPLMLPSGRAVAAITVVLDLLFLVLLSFTAVFTFREAWKARRNPIPRGDVTIPGPLVTRLRKAIAGAASIVGYSSLPPDHDSLSMFRFSYRSRQANLETGPCLG